MKNSAFFTKFQEKIFMSKNPFLDQNFNFHKIALESIAKHSSNVLNRFLIILRVIMITRQDLEQIALYIYQITSMKLIKK